MGILSKKKEPEATLRASKAPDYAPGSRKGEDIPEDVPLPEEGDIDEDEVYEEIPEDEEVTKDIPIEQFGFAYQGVLHDLRILAATAQLDHARIAKEEWVLLARKEELEEKLSEGGVSDKEIKRLYSDVMGEREK